MSSLLNEMRLDKDSPWGPDQVNHRSTSSRGSRIRTERPAVMVDGRRVLGGVAVAQCQHDREPDGVAQPVVVGEQHEAADPTSGDDGAHRPGSRTGLPRR